MSMGYVLLLSSAHKTGGHVTQEVSPPRRPGRPAQREGQENQRERLLDIGQTLLAGQGAPYVTMAAITKAAGITPSAAHYYFKTREQLLDALLEERIMPVRSYFEGVFEATPDDPVATMSNFVQRLVALNTKHPWFGPFWIREMISEDPALAERVKLRFGERKNSVVIGTLQRWQKEGRINPDLEPLLIFTSVIGLTLLPLAMRPKLEPDTFHSKVNEEQIIRHATALLTGGLTRKD